MAPVSDGLAARVVIILLVGLALVQGLIAVAMLSGPGRQALQYTLPLPNQIVAVIEAIEPADAAARQRIITALNSPSQSVQLLTEFPERKSSVRASPVLEGMLRRYADVLAEREFRIDTQRFAGFRARLRSDDSGAVRSLSPLRILVRLKDGTVLEFTPTRSAALAITSARIAGVAAMIGLIVVIAFLIAIRQTARPVKELARSAHRFASELDTPDLPETGPREIRELSTAFNEMKRTIRGLVTERTRVLAAIAHDMRTYLTRLRLRVDFIADQEQSQRAARDLDEMARLLDDTLLFARETTGPRASDASAGVAAVLSEVCEAKLQSGAEVTLNVAKNVGSVGVSSTTLARVTDNLIDNAIRYGARARVTAIRNVDEVHLIVDDDGPGIPEHEIARVVRPFERLEESRHRNTGGTGLGLAIVQALMEKAGGQLDIANRPAGGLRCTARFPVPDE
jgi:signal transduction histidine kinase